MKAHYFACKFTNEVIESAFIKPLKLFYVSFVLTNAVKPYLVYLWNPIFIYTVFHQWYLDIFIRVLRFSVAASE